MMHLSIDLPPSLLGRTPGGVEAVVSNFRTCVEAGMFWAPEAGEPRCWIDDPGTVGSARRIELTLQGCSPDALTTAERALQRIPDGVLQVMRPVGDRAAWPPGEAGPPLTIRPLPFEFADTVEGDLWEPALRARFVSAIDAELEARLLVVFDAWLTLVKDGAFGAGPCASPPPFVDASARYLVSPTTFEALMYGFFADYASFDALLNAFAWLHSNGHRIAAVELE
jgi:hypothetical protein